MEVWGALTSISVPDGSYGKLIVDNLDAKVSEVGGMSEADLHNGLDNYANKDDYKATTTISSNMRGTDGAVTSLAGIATSTNVSDAETNIINNIDTLTSTVDNMDLTVDNIDSTVDNIDSTVSNIDTTVDGIAFDVDEIDTVVSQIQDTVDDVEDKVDDVLITVQNNEATDTNELQNNQGNWATATTTISSNMRGTDGAITDLTTVTDALSTIDGIVNDTVVMVDSIEDLSEDIYTTLGHTEGAGAGMAKQLDTIHSRDNFKATDRTKLDSLVNTDVSDLATKIDVNNASLRRR